MKIRRYALFLSFLELEKCKLVENINSLIECIKS